jgi:cytochrome c oxidase cbb3-type subunit 3
MSLMPSFGHDKILTAPQVQDAASFVRSLSGLEPKGEAAQRGAEIFAINCVACHGPEGREAASSAHPTSPTASGSMAAAGNRLWAR